MNGESGSEIVSATKRRAAVEIHESSTNVAGATLTLRGGKGHLKAAWV